MAVKGYKRYWKLSRNVTSVLHYFMNKGDRYKTPLKFTTKPFKISFEVTAKTYLVFKEIFMSDVYAIDELVKRIPDKPIVVDIGSNVGFFDILIYSKLPGARVYAYEPLAANVDNLKRIIESNPILQDSILVHEFAVTGLPKESLLLYMENTDDSQIAASAFSNFHTNNTRQVIVPCITLTDIVEQHQLNHIDLLKIDCEGSEYDIIYNTDPELITRARNISLEVHDLDSSRNNFAAMKSYLIGLGYTINAEPLDDKCYAVEATRQ